MNFINRFFLAVVLAPSGFYRRLGINVDQLHSILTVKLMMDDRRANAFNLVKQKTKNAKAPTTSTIATMLVSLLMGLIFLTCFSIGKDLTTQLTFYFSFFMFMLASTLISDFTAVLIDVRDNLIILPKPVNDRTFVIARLLHIVIHIGKIILPMTIPGLIMMAAITGLGAIIFFVLVLLCTLLTIFFINAVYLIILRFTTPDKFKNIISYFQIFFAILIYASFQLLPRMFGKFELSNLSLRNFDWVVIFPGYWFGAAFETFYNLHPTTNDIIATIITLVFPFASIYLVIKYLAPAFNQKIAMLSGAAETVKTKTRHHDGNRGLVEKLTAIFTRGAGERVGFQLAWKISSRSRDFKVKTYPGIGYIFVMLIVMVMNMKGISLNDLRGTVGVGLVTMAIYIICFLVMVAVSNISVSDKFKAAWIYFTTPVEKPGHLISGAIKAMIAKFFLPLMILITITGFVLCGVSIIPNLILGLSNQLLILYATVFVSKRVLPFSSQVNLDQQGGNFIKALGRLLILGAIGFIHYLIYSNIILVSIVAVISIMTTFFLMKAIRETEWQQLQLQEESF